MKHPSTTVIPASLLTACTSSFLRVTNLLNGRTRQLVHCYGPPPYAIPSRSCSAGEEHRLHEIGTPGIDGEPGFYKVDMCHPSLNDQTPRLNDLVVIFGARTFTNRDQGQQSPVVKLQASCIAEWTVVTMTTAI